MDKELHETLKEMVMLLAILVRRGSMQSSLIREFNAVGFKPKRIAELLGTTPNTVSVALHQIKKSKSKK
jgi:CRP-like cAMP-binding protein